MFYLIPGTWCVRVHVRNVFMVTRSDQVFSVDVVCFLALDQSGKLTREGRREGGGREGGE